MRSSTGLLSTLFVAMLTAAATACAPPPPPAVYVIPPPPATATEPDPDPLVVAKDPEGDRGTKWLFGAWAWSGDVKEMHPDGTGTYYRDGEVCYRFTFTIEGNLLHTIADRDHHCGAKRENDWYVHLDQGEMQMKHGGSGYETRWKRVSGPLQKAAPDDGREP